MLIRGYRSGISGVSRLCSGFRYALSPASGRMLDEKAFGDRMAAATVNRPSARSVFCGRGTSHAAATALTVHFFCTAVRFYNGFVRLTRNGGNNGFSPDTGAFPPEGGKSLRRELKKSEDFPDSRDGKGMTPANLINRGLCAYARRPRFL